MKHTHTIWFRWWMRLAGLTLLLSGIALPTAGCRDTTSLCQHYVHKYAYCFRQNYQRALLKKRKLPLQQQKRMDPLMRQLEEKLKDSSWKKHAIQRCLQTPPVRSRYLCVRDASCNALSQCDPKRPI